MKTTEVSPAPKKILPAEVRSQQQKLWLAENQEAIAVYNENVARNGIWSDGRRAF